MSERNHSDRLAVLEVMVEMLTSYNMFMHPDTDQAMDDYRDSAAMVLCNRRPEEELDGLMSVLEERLMKVREHLHVVQRVRN